ncbi:MAG: hypothetical protein HYY23_10185 [Verrucomicrobia bacterium]|nr:hypothetical protein [Verrucomicrobiota bacterium]
MVTQTPVEGPAYAAVGTILDQRYPRGSRVVLVSARSEPGDARVLSRGLFAAGGPVVSPTGKRIFFSGKASANAAWQIYEARLNGGSPKAITFMPGGAMDPAIISAGDIIFSSPVPRAGETWNSPQPAALYATSPGEPPRRLTFGARAAVEPTVLRSGKILFVSAHPAAEPNTLLSLGLFSMNRDGTEVTSFALDRDGAPFIHRPRELPDGRVAFLAATNDARDAESWGETVRTARPFLSRGRLFSFPTGRCRSIEADAEGGLLVCFEDAHPAGRSSFHNRTAEAPTRRSSAVYRVPLNADRPGASVFDDPNWDEVEAVHVTARATPRGYLSTIQPAEHTGTILCLNADFTRRERMDQAPPARVDRIRVLSGAKLDHPSVLGEVPVKADGSFLVKVPADTPLGFEALDPEGRVLRRLPPTIWLRPGEHRSCLGCHEPPHRSPPNIRPLAAGSAPVVFADGVISAFAQPAGSRPRSGVLNSK